jgi:sugar lactone lactonase YvrE
MRIELLTDVRAQLGEGPVWDVQTQRIYWLDSVAGRIWSAAADGSGLRSWNVPERIGSMALRRDGSAVVALASGIHLLNLETGELTRLMNPEPDLPHNCLNDGKVDRQGRFVFGSMDTQEVAPSGNLYCLDVDLSLRVLDRGVIVSNGPCWSPDGHRFYFQDSYAREIWVYDYDTRSGAVSNRRVLARLHTETGAADGSTVDSEGCLWNAQIFDGKLVRYSPEGEVLLTIDMPVKKVTSVAFGGTDLEILFATSMGAQLLPHFPADGPQGGALFAVHGLGVTGLPELRFQG